MFLSVFWSYLEKVLCFNLFYTDKRENGHPQYRKDSLKGNSFQHNLFNWLTTSLANHGLLTLNRRLWTTDYGLRSKDYGPGTCLKKRNKFIIMAYGLVTELSFKRVCLQKNNMHFSPIAEYLLYAILKPEGKGLSHHVTRKRLTGNCIVLTWENQHFHVLNPFHVLFS